MEILENVSGFQVSLNIKDTSFSKSTPLVDPYVQELNTLHGDGPCKVYGRVLGIESAQEIL